MKPFVEIGETVACRQLSLGTFEMSVRAPRLSESTLAGQFVHVRVGSGFQPFLRRPLSVGPCRGDRLTLIFTVRGEGTLQLSQFKPGTPVDMIGPLGRPFPQPAADQTVVLVAGGIGIVPLLLLDDQLPTSQKRSFLLGVRSNRHLTASETDLFKRNIKISTDDGTMGIKGTVLDLLDARLNGGDEPFLIYGCGPGPMLQSLKSRCLQGGIGGWVSLEVPMGCGIGACQSCAVPRADGTGYLMVCRDGPVFDIVDVDLQPGVLP